MNDIANIDPLVGTIQHGGHISETPPDIDEFLTETGISEKTYTCTIKRAPIDGGTHKEFLPGSLKGQYMSIEDLGKRFGPGQYYYVFAWSVKDIDGKNKKNMKEYKVYMGSEWDDIHDEYQADLYFKKERKLETLAHKKKIKDASKGIMPDDKKADDPIENLRNTMGVMRDLGVPIGGNNLPASDSSNTMIMMMNLQQESSKNQMAMFMQMNQNMMQMMTAMMTNNKPQTNNDMMKEVLHMVTSAVDLKEALNPEKKGIVDKVFELAEQVLPSIMAIASQPKEKRDTNPLVQSIRNSADFDAIRKDPAMMKEAVKKWDEAHGVKQTDIILETVGLKRPGGVKVAKVDNSQVSDGDVSEVESGDVENDADIVE